MKKIGYISLVLLFVATGFLYSCGHEWDGVLGENDPPYKEDEYEFEPNITIAELKALYTDGTPVHIEKEYIIAGQITTTDQPGNVYRSFYIQDQSGGIEIKIGKTGLYNDYQKNRWIYVKLDGLTLGAYEGMLQIGLEDPTGEYETTYMDLPAIINKHIFKGKMGTKVFPTVVEESELTNSKNMGKYVTLNNLYYGNQVFCLIYPNQSGDKKSNSNRVFLSDKTWGITTWAMSQKKMKEYLESGIWDSATLADGSATVKQLRDENAIDIVANYVSQYFKMGGTDVQVRTSGYSKFADYELDPQVLDGIKSMNFTGILTNYRGAPQFTIVDFSECSVN